MTAYTFDPTHVGHVRAGHPERPERLERTMALLEAEGALAGLKRLPTPEAPREALARVHDPSYLDLLDAAAEAGEVQLDPDTYSLPASAGVARRAVGGLLAATDAVLAGEADNAFALARPPGHHARGFMAMGFCLYNGVAVAARHAQARHGVGRVLIVDVDVHHGNGTQETFYADPSVLFVSSHGYTGPGGADEFYPGTGGLRETGADAGAGLTVNLPLRDGTDDALVDLYRRVLPPIAARFRPELVLLSAGYDAHWLDPLGRCALSTTGQTELVRLVAEVADQHAGGRLVAVLEGGYHAEALAHGVLSTLRVLRDPSAPASDPFGPAERPGPSPDALWTELAALHRL